MDNNIAERVIKDYKLPIPLIPHLYEYYFHLYEPMLKTETIYNMLEHEVKVSGEPQDKYFGYLKKKTDEIIEFIKVLDCYNHFIDANNPDFSTQKGTPKFAEATTDFAFTKQTDVYKPENEGKKFVSIDLEKANYQSMRIYDKKLVLSTDSYEELCKKFINSDYFAGSKYIRQIIFGNLNSKRQATIQKYYTGKILDFLVKNGYFHADAIRVYTRDEIVFNADEFLSDERAKEIYDAIYDEFGLKTHVESYSVHAVYPTYYVKEKSDKSVSFKGVPPYYFSQVYKKYFNISVERNDLAFIFEKNLAYLGRTLDGKDFFEL
jgi:hypothetical protein